MEFVFNFFEEVISFSSSEGRIKLNEFVVVGHLSISNFDFKYIYPPAKIESDTDIWILLLCICISVFATIIIVLSVCLCKLFCSYKEVKTKLDYEMNDVIRQATVESGGSESGSGGSAPEPKSKYSNLIDDAK